MVAFRLAVVLLIGVVGSMLPARPHHDFACAGAVFAGGTPPMGPVAAVEAGEDETAQDMFGRD